MSDIDLSFPWYFYPLLVWFVAPFSALAGGVVGGFVTHRLSRRHRALKVIAAAVAGSVLLPLVVLLIGESSGGGDAAVRAVTLAFVALVGVGAVGLGRLRK